MWKNKLYFGDNLNILREHIPDESVDLIYIDPPFNSNANYNVLFQEKSGEKSAAQITAFEDMLQWGMKSERTFHEVVTEGAELLANLMQALRSFLSTSDMMAYLTMMAPRLVELHRVLKDTGSIYLHCDTTASHYLKLLLDAVFGKENFRHEIIWKRTSGHYSAKPWGPVHDTILFFSKRDFYYWNKVYQPYDEQYVESFYRYEDEKGKYQVDNLTGSGIRTGDSSKAWRGIDPTERGRHWAVPMEILRAAYPGKDLSGLSTEGKLDLLDAAGLVYWPSKGTVPRLKRYLDFQKGIPVQDLITDVSPITTNAAERLGYPTQKPEALLERIIKASSNEGGVVLDPFCGCGTTISVAERLHRQWIGIDITHLAIILMRRRLQDTYGSELSPYEVIGDPKDLHSAEALAREDRHQFQGWAVGLVEARPAQDEKKGADSGINGYIYFFDDNSGTAKKIIVQVKSGHVKVGDIRDLKGMLDREKAAIGAFITLEDSTKPMRDEAFSAGFYESEFYHGQSFPRLQILTIKELLEGKQLSYPRIMEQATFKKAERKGKGRRTHSNRSFVPSLQSEINQMNSFQEKVAQLPNLDKQNSTAHESKPSDPSKVFVVYGRNIQARNALFQFLRALGLKPIEWSQAIRATGKGSPYIGEILDAAFSNAQAVIVLMSPDDMAYLREPLWGEKEPAYETQPMPQARPNVLFEAGIALGRHPDRTVLVELGELRPFSDVAGRHAIRLNNSSEKRHDLADRLVVAGCSVDLSGRDWYTAGDFDAALEGL